MTAQTLVRDIVQLSPPGFPSLDNSQGYAKRHAIYIPQSFFEKARQAIADIDAESTWEFSAAVSPSTTPSSEKSSSSAASSPAQEIVIRYRAGMPLHLDISETRSNLSIDDEDDEEDGPSTYYTPIEGPEDSNQSHIETGVREVENVEIKIFYRQSCHQGVSKTNEALPVMETRGHREADSIACQQPGCSDTIWDTKDLISHHHVHDIHDGVVSCPRCHHFYENQLELGVHHCTSQRVRSLVAPLRSILRRILSKLAHRK